MRRLTFRISGGLAALALAVSACGSPGSDDSSDGGSSASEEAAPRESPEYEDVADLSKDWLLVRQSEPPDVGPHDGVYEAATGRRVAKLDADNPPFLGGGWVNEIPEAKSHGVAWIATEQDTDGPLTLYVATDGEPKPRKVAFHPNERLEIAHPMVTEDNDVMVQSAAIDPIGQQFADLENGELGFPVDATEDDREPIAYSDNYLITGGDKVEGTVLYKRVP